MSEFGEFTEVSDVYADASDIDAVFSEVPTVDDIPEDISYVENDVAISGDILSTDTAMDIKVDNLESDSFDEFLANEAEDNGLLDEIPEDVFGDTLGTDIAMGIEAGNLESEYFDESIGNEVDENVILDDIPESNLSENVITDNEFDWALENLSADELTMLKDSVASGKILVETADITDDGDHGYVKVKTR